MLVVYGHRVRSSQDKLLRLADECMTLLSTKMANNVGIWPVDVVPARTCGTVPAIRISDISVHTVRYLPLWFPGAGFKRKAAEWRALMQEFVDIPFEFVKQSMVCLPDLAVKARHALIKKTLSERRHCEP